MILELSLAYENEYGFLLCFLSVAICLHPLVISMFVLQSTVIAKSDTHCKPQGSSRTEKITQQGSRNEVLQ